MAKKILGSIFSIETIRSLIKDNSLTVFCYHEVSNKPSEFSLVHNLNTLPETFDYQIRLINENFNVISIDDLLIKKIPSKAALITFDDGFKSYFKNAIPILDKYDLPSIIFLNMEPIKGEIFWAGLVQYLCEKRPEFHDFIDSKTDGIINKKELHLYCSRDIVNSFIKNNKTTFKNDINKYIGEFATVEDLDDAATNRNVFFGNHLFNHDLPRLLTDNQLVESFLKNENELKSYPNFRSVFAFPYGQPGTSFDKRQINILLKNGARRVFQSSGRINLNPYESHLDRLALNPWENNQSEIWFRLGISRLRNYLRS
tara:strand:+ start:338 stop:1279 length:942 start_codon:yes stop_codon:yes gene_type:complete